MNRLVATIIFGWLGLLNSAFASALTLHELQQTDRLKIKTWLEPAAEIIAKQQVMLIIEVATDRWFAGGTRIGHFELRDAVALMREKFAVNTTRTEGDNTWTIQQWTLVVYPQREGVFEIPRIPLTITVAGDDGEPVSGKTFTHSSVFSAKQPLELQGRQDWVATTRFKIDESFNKPLESLQPGDALQRRISISADNLPAMMLPQTQLAEIPGIAIYTKPAKLVDKVNRGDYLAERHQEFTYIFESPGVFELPAETFYWWNLSSASLESVVLPGKKLEVFGQAITEPAPGTNDGQLNQDWKPDFLNLSRWGLGIAFIIILGFLTWNRLRRLQLVKRMVLSRWLSEYLLRRKFRQACRTHQTETAIGLFYHWLDHYGDPQFKGSVRQRLEQLDRTQWLSEFDGIMGSIYRNHQHVNDDLVKFAAKLVDDRRPSPITMKNWLEIRLQLNKDA